MANLRFDIIGDLGSIAASTFNDSINHALRILRELDTVISSQRGGFLRWYVAGLHANGRLSVDFTPHVKPVKPKVLKKVPLELSSKVADSFMTSFERIEREGTSPPYLSESGIQRIASLVQLINKNGARGFEVTIANRSIQISETSSEALQKIIRPKGTAIGSVEGSLKTISIHRGNRITVYHSITNKAVSCVFRDAALMDTARHAFGRRVIASGIVQYNAKGEPIRVDTDRLRVLGQDDELPSAADITGSDPGFTGGMSTADYIRSIRRA